MWFLLKTAILRTGTNGGAHAAGVPFGDLHVQELTCIEKMSSKKAEECQQWLFTLLFFFSCISTIIQCGTLHSRLQFVDDGFYMTGGLFADPLDSPGGYCAWNDHWYSVYSIFIYTHTVSLLRGLTVSVMDAVYTSSFHAFCGWVVTLTFGALPTRRSHGVHGRGSRGPVSKPVF